MCGDEGGHPQKNPHRYLSSRAKFTRSHAVIRLIYFQAAAFFLIYLCKYIRAPWEAINIHSSLETGCSGGCVISNFGERIRRVSECACEFSCGAPAIGSYTGDRSKTPLRGCAAGKAAGVYFCSISRALTRALNQLCYP